jgi:hypothetical protein
MGAMEANYTAIGCEGPLSGQVAFDRVGRIAGRGGHGAGRARGPRDGGRGDGKGTTSWNLLKTGVFFGMNPLALDWAQLLAVLSVTLAWISETLKRNRSIRDKLDEEWGHVR